jgi:hypothetical protein
VSSLWRQRGRELYKVRPLPAADALTTDAAVRTVILALVSELTCIPEADRDAAIDAAAAGYCEAHRDAGGLVTAHLVAPRGVR